MIAGGSGITPSGPRSKPSPMKPSPHPQPSSEPIEIWIVYGNRTEQDILIREELERLRVALTGNLHVWHVLSNCQADEEKLTMGRGHITSEVMRKHLHRRQRGRRARRSWRIHWRWYAVLRRSEKAVSKGLRELGWDWKDGGVLLIRVCICICLCR